MAKQGKHPALMARVRALTIGLLGKKVSTVSVSALHFLCAEVSAVVF